MVTPKNLISTLQNTSGSSKEESKNFSPDDYLCFDDDHIVPDLIAEATAGVTFLCEHFPRKLFTFQYLKDKRNAGVINLPSSNPTIIVEELYKSSKAGKDICFMVNEGNGVTPPGKLMSRCQESVINLSACFIDTDNCPIEKVKAYLTSLNLIPSIEIESSANRFHIYFLLEDCEKTPANLKLWGAVQGMLARLGDPAATKDASADTSMSECSKLLKVPGFTHQTKKFVAKVVSTTDYKYDLADLFELTNAKDFQEYNLHIHGSVSPSHVPVIGDKIENGCRYDSAQRFSMSLANKPGTLEEKLSTYAQFIQTFDNTDPEFLKDGQLTQKALDLFNSANKKIEIEVRTNYELMTVDAPSLPEVPLKSGKPYWYLPPEFYTSAPNGIGQAVKEIMHYSKYQSAQLSHACFLAGLSMMKGSRYLTQSRKPCSLNIIIVAPPSYGKQDPSTIVEKSLREYGYGGHIFTQPRSKEGTINFLAQHQSFGMSISDEIGEFLIDLTTKKDNITYQQLDAFLKEISTACKDKVMSAYVTDTGKKKGSDPVVLKYPVLSILGSTTPDIYRRAFNQDSLTGGLFQRFTPIVVDFEDLMPNPHANAQASITCEVFEELRQHPVDESNATNLSDIQTPVDAKGEPIFPPDTEDKAFRPPPQVMPATPEAIAMMFELDCHYKKIYNRQFREGIPTYAFYGRVAEKIERIATVVALKEIKVKDVEYAQRLVESITAQQIDSSTTTVLSTDKGRQALEDEGKILSAMQSIASKTGSNIMLRTEVATRVRGGRINTAQDFDRLIQSLESLGKVDTDLIRLPNAKKSTRYLILK